MANTWLITGSSSGFGLALVRLALAKGDNVIATSRNPSKNPEYVKEISSHPNGRWLTLDVLNSQAEIQSIIDSASKEFNGIDILVNNAGYSVLGAAEEIPEDKAKHQFETNFWGAWRVIKAVLPQMRARKSGTIVNITSIGGLTALPAVACYASSKFALEALSESLATEVQTYNIRVLIVEPGAFRTNFLGPNALTSLETSEAYKGTIVEETAKKFETMEGKQRGDPQKAAERIYDVVMGQGMARGKEHLLRLPLGQDCVDRATTKLKSVLANFEEMNEIACSTDIQE